MIGNGAFILKKGLLGDTVDYTAGQPLRGENGIGALYDFYPLNNDRVLVYKDALGKPIYGRRPPALEPTDVHDIIRVRIITDANPCHIFDRIK